MTEKTETNRPPLWRYKFENAILLIFLAQVAEASAQGVPTRLVAGLDPTEEAMARSVAGRRGFLTDGASGCVSPAGRAWAAGQVAPLRALLKDQADFAAPARLVKSC